MGCVSSAPVAAAESGESQLSSPSARQQRASAEKQASLSNSTRTTKGSPLFPFAALAKLTPPQAQSPERPRRGGSAGGGGSSHDGSDNNNNNNNNNAGLSTPLSSLEEPPLSGESSTTSRQRGWRRSGRDGGDASSRKNLLPLARPASSAALALRVLEEDEEEELNKSLHPLIIVTDDYALGRVLGRGQFGTTRLATRRDDGRLFACKIILKRRLSTPAAIAAVRREIAIMKRLDHPSIVKLRGAYEDDRAVHLVVELCQGGELLESIARNGKFSERCAASRARSMLETVCYLHSRGVVHRDLKPENFLLSTKDGESPIKMIDFGLSAYAREGEEDEERLSDVVGTAYYMAPEVLRGRYGHKADIWSVGVICYLMLAGEPPFRGDSERATFHSIVHDEPEFKGPAWRHVSPAAKEAIAAMLRKDPRKRPNAAELLREFEWLEEAKEKTRRAAVSVSAATAASTASTAAAASPAAAFPNAAASAASVLSAFRKKSKPPQPPLQGEEQAPSSRPLSSSPPPRPSSSSSPAPSPSLQELSAPPLDPAVKESLRLFVGIDKLRRQAAAAASAALSPSSSSNKLSRGGGGGGGGGEQEGDASCGCSLSSSMCDLFAAEESAQQQGQHRHQQQQEGELLQLEQHHLSSQRPASAPEAPSECTAGLGDSSDALATKHRSPTSSSSSSAPRHVQLSSPSTFPCPLLLCLSPS